MPVPRSPTLCPLAEYRHPTLPQHAKANTPMDLSLAQARHLALHTQGLTTNAADANTTFDRLGYVQIDTIAVIERAHHHILWTRQNNYTTDQLNDLQMHQRTIFEYWAHAAAFLPMADYRYYRPRMLATRKSERHIQWRRDNSRLVRQVLQRIRKEGALAAADFEDTSGKRGPWWDWKPAKRALELLYDTGELMVSGRRQFQRLYDLPERVLPADLDTSNPTPAERARFSVSRTLQAHGLAALRQFRLGLAPSKDLPKALEQLQASGAVVPIKLEGTSTPYFAWQDALDQVPAKLEPQCHLLSPFDNLVIDRPRLEQLFGFHYRIECYVPAAKRQYGYFTLPILWGDRLVGRLDPKAQRQQGVFEVRGLFFEPDFAAYDDLLPALAQRLQRFAAFNGCGEITIAPTTPRKVRAPLRRALAALA
ncbi:MAG: hypothetical protein GKR89_10060 [Candidatus Latescibacteria bacterium]|nr:hypothetical protein [Candidatus Latescibacterota bacterium]